MLKNIKISNFCSIGAEQEISFEIGRKDMLDDSATQIDTNVYLNRVSCIIGPNASGKTTILKAISFIFWFINESYTSQKKETKIPIKPHKLREGEATKIEIEFYNQKNLYKYLIEFNQEEVLRESLDKKNERMINIFTLSREKNKIFLKTNHLKINEADETRFKERRNVSLLSCLIDTNYLPEIVFFKEYNSNVNQFGTTFFTNIAKIFNVSEEMKKNETLCREILQLSKDIDLGISDFRFTDFLIANPNNPDDRKMVPLLECIHSPSNKEFILGLFEESNGTQHYIYLLSEILPILKNGGHMMLDEIESGLHPDVTKKIIFLFEDKRTNPNNAQLFFSTHQHPLLIDRTKTQIFIVEKESSTSESEIYRLDDVEGVRNDENFFHKYIAGTYGGTPNVKWL